MPDVKLAVPMSTAEGGPGVQQIVIAPPRNFVRQQSSRLEEAAERAIFVASVPMFHKLPWERLLRMVCMRTYEALSSYSAPRGIRSCLELSSDL